MTLVIGISAADKWGELLSDVPVNPGKGTALGIIGVLTLANVATWLERSSSGWDEFSEFY